MLLPHCRHFASPCLFAFLNNLSIALILGHCEIIWEIESDYIRCKRILKSTGMSCRLYLNLASLLSACHLSSWALGALLRRIFPWGLVESKRYTRYICISSPLRWPCERFHEWWVPAWGLCTSSSIPLSNQFCCPQISWEQMVRSPLVLGTTTLW